MVKNLLFCGIICLLATGCAFTRTETDVHFSPIITDSLGAQKKASLTVAEIKDSRSVEDKFVIMHKANQYGTTSGAYVTKTPVSDILRDGLIEALQQNGFINTNTNQYELRADMQEFSGDAIEGFWKATVKSKLTVRFELVDKSSGKTVWHDTFIGLATNKTAWGDRNFVAKIFSDSANDLVQQLLADKEFRGFFEQ
jgi:hypothetical protein